MSNRGKKTKLLWQNPEYRKHMSEVHKGQHSSPNNEFKKGHTAWNKGKKYPQVTGEKCNFWKGGRTIHTAGYILIYQPKHPFHDTHNYVFEHRLVIEKQIERYLKPREEIHHLGKKYDNRPHMLMAFVNHSAHKRFENSGYVKSEEIIFDGRLLPPM